MATNRQTLGPEEVDPYSLKSEYNRLMGDEQPEEKKVNSVLSPRSIFAKQNATHAKPMSNYLNVSS